MAKLIKIDECKKCLFFGVMGFYHCRHKDNFGQFLVIFSTPYDKDVSCPLPDEPEIVDVTKGSDKK